VPLIIVIIIIIIIIINAEGNPTNLLWVGNVESSSTDFQWFGNAHVFQESEWQVVTVHSGNRNKAFNLR
jgi:hypothetical protein